MAELGLHYCVGFSLVAANGGYSLAAGQGLLTAVASCCTARAPGARTVVTVARWLNSSGARASCLDSSGARASCLDSSGARASCLDSCGARASCLDSSGARASCLDSFGARASCLDSFGARASFLNSFGARASFLRVTWDLPRSGTEPVSPVLAGGFFTTEPPGKPPE